MLYKLFKREGRTFKHAQIESWDGVVIGGTPAFLSAVGKDIGNVLYSLECQGWGWRIVNKRYPSLQHPTRN